MRLVRSLLLASSDVSVVGVDSAAPVSPKIPAFQFVQADIRDSGIGDVLREIQPEIVVHLDVTGVPTQGKGRAITKEVNVIGTMQLMAACQRVESVRKLVIRSSTAVYGCSSNDPAMFTEDASPTSELSGYAKDAAEVESYVRGFARRRPDVGTTVLRLANVLGAGITTPLSSYFSLPVVPTVLGFDARLQFVHPDDAVAVLARAVLEDHPGVFNVAAGGILTLSQAIRRAGRLEVPLPKALTGLSGLAAGLDLSGEQLRFLTFGRVADASKLVYEFGYEPRFSTMETFDAFVYDSGLRPVIDPMLVDMAQQRLSAYVRAVP